MRIVIKIGTSTLAHPTGHLNIRRVEQLCKVMSDIRNAGHELILVSSGAIGMGVGKLNLPGKPADMPTKQAAAAVGQCELMYTYDRLFGEYNHTVAQILLTGEDIDHADRRQNFENTMFRLLELGALPIINENDTVATAEIKVGDNDTLGAIVACTVKADLLVLLSDIEGLYTADPRKVNGAFKLDEITYDEMLELASLGAQVLHNRSVEMAKRYHVNLEVLSSLTGNPGTNVKEVVKKMEKSYVSGVAKDKNVARLALVGLADEPGIAFKIFSLLGKNKINVDIILQSIGRSETKDISFTVARSDMEIAKKVLEENREMLGFSSIETNDQVAKVSVVGAGMVNSSGVAAKMFEALYSVGINISMISTSEIKISVLMDERDADRAVQAIHDRFFSEFGA